MKKDYKIALKIYKYLVIIFSIIYWVYIIIDDWLFIKKYWNTNWLEYLGIWTLWFLVYALILTLYYWALATLIILINHKIIKPIKKKTI